MLRVYVQSHITYEIEMVAYGCGLHYIPTCVHSVPHLVQRILPKFDAIPFTPC